MNPLSSSKVSHSRAWASLAVLAAVLPMIGCSGDGAGDTSDLGTLGNEVNGPGFGVDYAWARPSPATIEADGYGFVARYLSYDTTGKNLSASEANALIAAGLDVVVVWEQGAQDALQGFNLGVTHAKAAESQAVAAGQPAGRPIYFAIDFDAQASQQTAIDAYYQGVASVIGLDRTGAYGGYGPVNRLFNDGKITWAWQTYAWSSSKWDSRAQLRQVLNDIGPNGEMDKDQSMVADFGQWGPGNVNSTPPPPPSPTACVVAGVDGVCIATSDCAAMAGYVSTAGHCAGAANIECCTPAVTTPPPPPPPPPAACVVGGVDGVCISTATCASMAGYVSTAGHCAGAANIECCTPPAAPPPPPPPAPTCQVSGVDGVCITTATCASMAGYVSTAGHCPGAANIECCTPPAPPPSCIVAGVTGTCIQTSMCAMMPGYHATPGYCPGSATEECCTQ